MASVPVSNTAQVELLYTLGGEGIENTLYFEFPATITLADLTELKGALSTWWTDEMQEHFALSLGLHAIRLTDLTSPTSPGVELPVSPVKTGLVNADPLPNNVAPCISFRTALRGRSFRGRNYLSGLPDTVQSGNTIQDGVLGGLQVAYNELLDLAAAVGCTWVVVSRYSGIHAVTKKPIPRASGITTPVVAASFADNIVDSQRRRLPRH
jgi:hypothetical protein